jgi:magnesium chelatase subunit D
VSTDEIEASLRSLDLFRGRRPPGKGSRAVKTENGRYTGSRSFHEGERITDIAADAVLRHAAVEAKAPGERFRLSFQDLRKKIRKDYVQLLLIFLLDVSDSMGLSARMSAAKAAVRAVLGRASRDRSRTALVTFGGRSARLIIPPTSAPRAAETLLGDIGSGGATPLAAGLQRVIELARAERRRHSGLPATVILLSDGEANVPLVPGRTVPEELAALGTKLSEEAVRLVLVDVMQSAAEAKQIRHLASLLSGEYLPVRVRA